MGASMLSWLELADDFLDRTILSPARLPDVSPIGLKDMAITEWDGTRGFYSNWIVGWS